MTALNLLSDEEIAAIPEVKAVIDDIREVRKTNFINNFWRGLANDPAQLARVWQRVKEVMLTEGELSSLTKELIYIAVSRTNNCAYCTQSHTVSARGKGLTAQKHQELLSVIELALQTNAIATALDIPVDEVFVNAEFNWQ